MRPLFWILLAVVLIGCQFCWGAEYFVAPAGDDASSGTRAAPFATLQRAQRDLSPGDTVWLRGGTYRLTDELIAEKKNIFARVIVLDKSGQRGAPIQILAAPGEKPVFDFSNVKPAGHRVIAFYVTGSWLVLRGIEVVGVQVTIREHTVSVGFENQGSFNRYEQCSVHDGMAAGFACQRGEGNLFLNCDAYRNYDSVSENGRGGNVDGFGCHTNRLGPGNVFRGCRAWLNSDDGYDCINAYQSMVFENCWAMKNGFSPDGVRRADGNGFKAGGYGGTPANRLPNPIPRHRVIGCLSIDHPASGFYANHHPGGIDFIQNTAYRNGANFNMLSRQSDNITDVPGYGHVLINNLSWGSRRDVVQIDPAQCTVQTNSWDLNLKLSSRDFDGVDETQLTRARGSDGSLPRVDFLKLRPGSAAVGRGTPLPAPDAPDSPPSGARRRGDRPSPSLGCFPPDRT